jgi:outer membrane biosynthesis protein TonB
MGINVAVLTYNGTAYFGFSGDAHAAPDLLRLEKFVAISFDELKKSTGVKPVVQAKQKPETRKPAAKKPETKRAETKKPETKKPERIVAEKKRSASIKKEIAPEKKKVVPARNRPNDSSASATKPVVSVSRLKPESVSASVPLEGLALAVTNS